MSLMFFLSFAGALVSALLALGVLGRSPRSLVNWAFVLGLATLAAEAFCSGMAMLAIGLDEVVYWQKGRHLAMALLPGIWLFFSLIYSRAEWAKFVKGWRFALGVAVVVPLVLGIVCRGAITTEIRVGETGGTYVELGWAGLGLNLALLLGSILVLVNLERTFKASVGTMRWRVKYMVLGLGLLFGVRIYTSSQALLYRAVNPSLPAVEAIALLVGCALTAVALLRAKLEEIEIYPSHAVLQGSLTVLLAGIYLLIVGLFARVAGWMGGSAAFPIQSFAVLVAIAGLGMLLLSDRIRQRMRLAVSRHFHRPLYDYRKVWSAFTERTTSLVDRVEFCRAVAKLASDTFGCLSVTVWLVDEAKQQLAFATSTLLAEQNAQELLSRGADSGPVLAAIRRHPYPVDIDSGKEDWLADLQKWNPDFFVKGGNRVCVPLISAGEVLGLLALADRVNGVRFSVADLDLLKCIGDQVAASLRNIQLSEQILRAKEMAAFQTMSAFFVHDLKNMAYTLSLMLQNMSAHFGDPAFREDALRSVGKSVARLNELVGRFSLLRQGMDLKRVDADLNEVVGAALKGLEESIGMKLVQEFLPLPRMSIDPDQFQKVVTNLVLNARDAVGPTGTVTIKTSRRDGWAVLAVTDDGCGMSREFVEKSLFKPFQTTKKTGLGIGMYHSKMIVEAHRGKMEVTSETGQGSTFRVLLPIENATP